MGNVKKEKTAASTEKRAKNKARTGAYKLFTGIPLAPFSELKFTASSKFVEMKEGDLFDGKTRLILRKSGALIFVGHRYDIPKPHYIYGAGYCYDHVRDLVEACLSFGLCTKEDVAALKAWFQEKDNEYWARNTIEKVREHLEALTEGDKDEIARIIGRPVTIWRRDNGCDT